MGKKGGKKGGPPKKGGGGGGGGGARGGKKDKKSKKGKKALLDRKEKYMEKKVKQAARRKHAKTVKDKKHWSAEQSGSTVTIAWRGKQRSIEKADLQKDPHKRQLLKKIREKRVLNQDEKHTLKMLGEGGSLLQLWEKLRVKTKGKDAAAEKHSIIDKVLKMTEKDFSQEARKPDVSRVLQSCVKWGSHEQRKTMADRIAGSAVELSQSKFSNQFVRALLDHCAAAERDALCSELSKSCSALLSHRYALTVLDFLHNRVNATKQHELIAALFDGLQLKKLKGYPRIDEILQEADPTSLDYKQIIERLYKHVSPLLTKGAFDFHIAHRLTEMILRFGTEIEIAETVEELSKGVVHICKTRYGAMSAALLLAHASHARRRQVIRSFEHSVSAMCTTKQTSWLVARLFDLADEPGVISKVVVREIIADLPALLTDPIGGLPILHLLTPSLERKKRYFLGHHLEPLWHDGVADPFHMTTLTQQYQRKKKRICEIAPKEKHQAALRELAPAILEVVKAEPELLKSPHCRRVLTELAFYCEGASASDIGLSTAAVAALRSQLGGGSAPRRPRDEEPGSAAPPARRRRLSKSAKPAESPTAAAEPAPAAAAPGRKRKASAATAAASPAPTAKAPRRRILRAKVAK